MNKNIHLYQIQTIADIKFSVSFTRKSNTRINCQSIGILPSKSNIFRQFDVRVNLWKRLLSMPFVTRCSRRLFRMHGKRLAAINERQKCLLRLKIITRGRTMTIKLRNRSRIYNSIIVRDYFSQCVTIQYASSRTVTWLPVIN